MKFGASSDKKAVTSNGGVQLKGAEKRIGGRSQPGGRLLLSCLSRLILEPQRVKPYRAGMTAVDPVLISRAVVDETISHAAKRAGCKPAPAQAAINLTRHPRV
jgi:hypothetical protein